MSQQMWPSPQNPPPAYPNQGQYGQPYGPPGAQRQPGPVSLPPPVAVAAVEGTNFGVAIVAVPATTSGPATASLVTGVASILVSFVVGCFGVIGVRGGWGPLVAGAFAVLAGLLGIAAVVLARFGMIQMRRRAPYGGAVNGRGLAIAGMICGIVGLAFTAGLFVLSVGLVAAAG